MKHRLRLFCAILTLLIACNSRRSQSSTEECISRLKNYDVRLELPLQGEWLYEHPEPGQTFDEYVKADPVRANEVKNKIYIQPLGGFTPLQLKVIENTSVYLNLFFNREVKILPVASDQIVSDSLKRFKGSNDEQLLTTPILDYLQKNMPSDGLMVMALTSKDLYPGATYNFVFGQARTKKRVGVSSIHRYSNDLSDSTLFRQCLERLIKTSSHEMCHMLSFEHCTNAVCVMNGSNSMAESDSRPNRLCSACLKKLQWNLSFDIPTRLKALDSYFRKHKLEMDLRLSELDFAALK